MSLKTAALGLGEKFHPIMGPIFSGRPSSAGVGDTCSMCIGDTPAAADSAIPDSNGRTLFVCLHHELLLHRTFDADKAGRTGLDEYEAEILGEILFTATRPGWMPLPIYEALTRRAERKARLLAILSILPKARPLLDARTATPTD